MAKHKMHLDDEHKIGELIRRRRLLAGLTQQQLADKVGVTYQQMHKYERGINRVSSAMLWRLAGVLVTPIEEFFIGMDEPKTKPLAHSRMRLEIGELINGVSNEESLRSIANVVRALVATEART